jgi:hypothetical protein
MLDVLMITLFKQEMPSLQKSKRRSFHLVNQFACLCKKSHDEHKNHSRKHKIGQKNFKKQAI